MMVMMPVNVDNHESNSSLRCIQASGFLSFRQQNFLFQLYFVLRLIFAICLFSFVYMVFFVVFYSLN